MPLMLKVTSATHTHYENLQPTGNLIFCLKITVETLVSEATSSAFPFKNIISMKGRVKILKSNQD